MESKDHVNRKRKRSRPETPQKSLVIVLCLLLRPLCAHLHPSRGRTHVFPEQGRQKLPFIEPRIKERGPYHSSFILAASVASKSSSDSRPIRSKSFHNRKQKSRKGGRQRIRELFRKAKDLERRGQWRKAARVLNDILGQDPTDAHSHLALARLEARRSPDKSTASAVFDAGTAACPGSVHLWQAWAVHEEASGFPVKAGELFQRALELDRYNPYVCHAYGLMEHKLGHTEEARQLWEHALEKTSTAALVCSLGELLIGNQEFEKARNLYADNVVRLESNREKTEVYLASAWLEERYFHNMEGAREMIKLSLASCPNSSRAQVALARLEGRSQHNGGRVRSATVRRLERACLQAEKGDAKDQPEDGRIYNAWANLEVKARRYKEARRILRRGLSRYPKDHSLLQAAGTVEERMGNYTRARDFYSASLRIQPSAPTLVAYSMLELRHPDESSPMNFTAIKQLFEEALLLDPRHGPAYNAYARSVFERERDEDETRSIYERGVCANCSDVASIYHGYAMLELSLGNVDRTRELLLQGQDEARRHDIGMDSPHRERAVFLTHSLGVLELHSNRPLEALKVFTDGIDRYGNSSQLLLGAALCESKLGNEQKARELFERSVLSDEKHAQAWQAWGVMEMRAGNFKAAKTLFECGIKSAPRHGALWQAYGTMESRMGNTDNARSLFEKGIKLAPMHVPLYQSWASTELRNGNFLAAKALISQALTRDKRNGEGWLIAAEIEQRMGNHGLGSLLLRRGIECAPANARLYRALGDSLVGQGKINEAREIFEKGMEVDPMHAPLYHSLAELEARVFNVEGLAILNKRAAEVFNANALEPSSSSSEVLGSKIRAGRIRDIPKDVAALAQRIVEDDASDLTSNDSDTNAFLESLVGSNLLEVCLSSSLLDIPEQGPN